ncbi:MAG: hypothetical protein ABJZ55_22930 [Fuerstiella sp.]
MRRFFIIACALLMALPLLPMPEAEAGRSVSRRVSRSFNRGFNQGARTVRQSTRNLGRSYRTPVRYSSGVRSSRYQSPYSSRGVYFGSGRSGVFLRF